MPHYDVADSVMAPSRPHNMCAGPIQRFKQFCSLTVKATCD